MVNGRKIAYMPTGSYEQQSIEEICAGLKSLGYDAIEWTQFFADPENHTEEHLKKLVRIPGDFGLEVSEIVVQRDLIVRSRDEWRRNVDFIIECINRYSEIGVQTINLFTGPVPWVKNPLVIGEEITEGDAWSMLFSAFDEIVMQAEKKQMNLAVENVWLMLCHDFFTMQYLINHYNSSWLGVNYDPSHDVLAGHTDVGWIIRQWGNQIKHIHLKDAVGIQKLNSFIFPLLGEGNVNWEAFKNALDDIDYKGFMSVEFESFTYVDKIWKNIWEKAARNSIENIRILFGEN